MKINYWDGDSLVLAECTKVEGSTVNGTLLIIDEEWTVNVKDVVYIIDSKEEQK